MQYLEKRNFNNALQHISAFSKQSKKEIEISKVATSGSFWRFTNHNVTGSELNEVTSEIQQHMISFNDMQMKFVREFQQIYTALDAIDKDFIDAINSNIKSVELVSGQALKAGENAMTAIGKAQKAQDQVRQTVETQKKIVDVLVEFKKRIDNYEHLEHIDEIWKDVNVFKVVVDRIEEEVDACNKQADNNKRLIESAREDISTMVDAMVQKVADELALLKEKQDTAESRMANIQNAVDSLNQNFIKQLTVIKERQDAAENKADNMQQGISDLENKTRFLTHDVGNITSLLEQVRKEESEEKEKLNSFITEYREEKTALDDTVKLLENRLDAAYKLAWGAVAVAVISLGLAVSTMVK